MLRDVFGQPFQSTLPIREETRDLANYLCREQFQSTLPIREETCQRLIRHVRPEISIHSSHTGRDEEQSGKADPAAISIHSSHTGRDPAGRDPLRRPGHFNPLFPYGKRPAGSAFMRFRRPNFNPLFPYGKRQRGLRRRGLRRNFNPLFPYGKRPILLCCYIATNQFQSTLPIREETRLRKRMGLSELISIHSSHTGRDDHRGRRSPGGAISIHSSHTGRDLAGRILIE